MNSLAFVTVSAFFSNEGARGITPLQRDRAGLAGLRRQSAFRAQREAGIFANRTLTREETPAEALAPSRDNLALQAYLE